MWHNNASQLYFAESNIEEFVARLESYGEQIEVVNGLTEHSWGQKMVRFYDLDGKLIEVRTQV